MNIHAVISVVAMLAYLGLVLAVWHRGERFALPRRIFFLYLILMFVQQTIYLVISLAKTVAVARIAYYSLVAAGAAPWLAYFLFIEALLKRPHARIALGSGLIFLAALAVTYWHLSPGVYRAFSVDPQTGLIVPVLGPWIAPLASLMLVFVAISAVELVRAWRGALDPASARRAQYLLLGLVIVFLGQLANAPESWRPYPIDVVATLVNALLIGHAMSRNELLELPFAARRVLLRSAPAVLLLVIWFSILRHVGALGNFEALLLGLLASSLSTLAAWTLGERFRLWGEELLFPRHYRMARMVERVSRRAASVLDLEPLAGLILDDLVKNLEARWAGLFLIDDAEGSWSLVASRKHRDDGKELSVVSALERLDSLSDELAAQGPRLVTLATEEQTATAVLLVPLRAREDLIGFYCIVPILPGKLSFEIERLLQTLASQTSISIDNARLHDHLRQQLVERKRMETSIVHMQKMEAMGTLASGVAHDMNNILGAAMALASVAREDALEGRSIHPADLEQIVEACRRGRDLTDALLGFAKQRAVTRTWVDLSVVIRDVMILLHRTVPKNIKITSDVEGQRWAVEADRSQLDTVVMNVCLNAVAAMGERGTLTLTVDEVERIPGVQSESEGRYVRVRITDDGTGMDEETIRQVFDPFFTTRAESGGTGLGLSMVYGIIRSHDGSVAIDSKIGQGTTVTLFLPAVQHGGINRPAPEHEPLPRFPRLRLLLVDDESLVRRAGQRVLRRLGCHVDEAVSGADAVKFLSENSGGVDAIVLDMIMPGMDGEETFHALRAVAPSLPVLLCSGFTDREQINRLLEHDKVGFLSKPFDVRALRRELLELVGTPNTGS